MNVREELFKNQDLQYKAFHARLVPNISSDKIIGVRVPVLRRLAKQVAKENAELSDEYYEERMIKGFVIGYKKCSLDERLQELEKFIPLIDNWAVCDCACSTFKFTKNNREAVWSFIQPYLSGEEYDIRFSVVMIMDYFMTDEYIDKALSVLSSVKSDYYYVNTAVAWAVSVAFVKYQEKTLPLLEGRVFPAWVHNKSIQKICESGRVEKQTKEYLKTQKV